MLGKYETGLAREAISDTSRPAMFINDDVIVLLNVLFHKVESHFDSKQTTCQLCAITKQAIKYISPRRKSPQYLHYVCSLPTHINIICIYCLIQSCSVLQNNILKVGVNTLIILLSNVYYTATTSVANVNINISTWYEGSLLHTELINTRCAHMYTSRVPFTLYRAQRPDYNL